MANPPVSLPESPALPPSHWQARCHPLEPEVSRNVHNYFLAGWKFRSEKARVMFPLQGLATWHCYAYPKSRDDRIEPGAILTTLLFLVDDELEHMSLEEGSRLVERIISIVGGDLQPDTSVPAEWMTKEVWDNLTAIDAELTEQMKEPAYVFWRSQVAAERLAPKTLKSYLRYREADIASAFLCAIQRFSMEQHIPAGDLSRLAAVEKNYSDYITVVNDICSYDKEARTAEEGEAEGATICSSVQVLAEETGLLPEMAKRVLWAMCREWETNHDRLVVESAVPNHEGPEGQVLMEYLDGLKLQISGTEAWSLTSFRYNYTVV